MPSRQGQYWPEHWDGALAAAQKYFREAAGLLLQSPVSWLVERGELPRYPSDHFDPRRDARAHLALHASAPCLACGVWRMLDMLWTFAQELHDGQQSILFLRQLHTGERAVDSLRESAQRLGSRTSGDGLVRLEGFAGALPGRDLFADAADVALQSFGPYARDCVQRGGRMDGIVAGVCQVLHRSGFTFAEVAWLIGDGSDVAVDRVRKRCLSTRGVLP